MGNHAEVESILRYTQNIRAWTYDIEAQVKSIRARELAAPSRSRCQMKITRMTGKSYRCLRFDDHQPVIDHFYEDQIWPGVE